MKPTWGTDYESTKASDAGAPVSVVGALVDPDIMMRMRLTAMNLRKRFALTKCCGCAALKTGGLLICCYMACRGIISLMETFPTGALRDAFPVVFVGYSRNNPFIALAFFLLVVSGPLDIIASLVGILGIVTRNASAVAVAFIWMLIRMFFTVVFVAIVIGFDTPGLGVWWDLLIASVWVPIDLYFIYIVFEVLTMTLLQGTVANSMLTLLGNAQQQARIFSHDRCDVLHILAGLLQDKFCCDLLTMGGVDCNRLAADLTSVLQDQGQCLGWGGDADMPVTKNATELLVGSMQLQGMVGDDRLTADHVLMTLCGSGFIRFGPRSVHVNSLAIRNELAQRRANEGPQSPPGATLFGCVPLEETVAVWLVIQIASCIVSIGCLLIFGRSISVMGGLRTVKEMRTLEFFGSLSGVVLGLLALWGISTHRATRREVRDEAKKHGITQWQIAEANLDVAFAVVSMKQEQQPQVEKWLGILRRSVTFLCAYLAWDAAQLFVQLPMIGMAMAIGNTCGANIHGLINISRMGVFTNAAPMHCSLTDVFLILNVLIYLAVDAYMFWGALALWHEYQYGWTTTDPRGIEYLDPIGPLPQNAVRQLSGLPGRPRERKFASDRLMEPSETRPLLL